MLSAPEIVWLGQMTKKPSVRLNNLCGATEIGAIFQSYTKWRNQDKLGNIHGLRKRVGESESVVRK